MYRMAGLSFRFLFYTTVQYLVAVLLALLDVFLTTIIINRPPPQCGRLQPATTAAGAGCSDSSVQPAAFGSPRRSCVAWNFASDVACSRTP